jgi:2'-5' RNA ligase
MDYFLGIPLPPSYAARIEAFRREITDWAFRPQRSEPHISVKGGAGLDDGPETAATVEEIAACTVPFSIQLGEPAIFEGEPVLYLSVVSPGWSALHRVLVDTIAARTGATMHPLEIGGWIPHLTVIRVKPELLPRQREILSLTRAALSPFPEFTADTLRMYRQERNEGPWEPFRDFALSGRPRET